MKFWNEWTKKIEELEAENKILKKENMAYKGLWEEIGIVPIKLANDFQEIEQIFRALILLIINTLTK